MKLDQTFTVQAPSEMVWKALIDVERVAPCLPGASVTGREADGSYKGEFKVKLGPTTAAYNGVLKMETVDDSAQTATMSARGTDKRGQGGATASIVSSVHAGDSPGETRVDVITDFSITGRLARFGRGGMIQDVANRLLREFAANLQAQLAAEGAGEHAHLDPGAQEAAAAAPVLDDPGDPHAAPGPARPYPPSGASAPPPRPPAPPAKPVSGLALMVGAFWDWLRRLLRRLFRRDKT